MMKLIFLLHLAVTLILVGLIWFVQIVHYPLFGRVDRASFAAYEAAHTRLTMWVVAPLMFTEGLTAMLLVLFRPIEIRAWQVWLGVALVLIIWLSTIFWQVPRHDKLKLGFDATAHQFLVRSNWLRTFAWSARGLLVLWMVAAVMN